ncbi:MAG: hydroxyacid dehydrogenase [Firmicutes bacterium]|nr:hydroxyacid dehydrogenase [Bacillota bacterium]
MESKQKLVFLMEKKLGKTLFDDRVLTELITLFHTEWAADLRPATLQTTLQGADVAVTSWGTPALTDEILQDADHLRLVVHAAGSVKPIVTEALYDRGVIVTSGAGTIARGVAETTLGLLITSLKNVFALNTHVHQGGWREASLIRHVKDLYGINIGIIGAGHVGRHMLRLLQQFEVNRLLYDPTLSGEEATKLGATKVELTELLRRSDAVLVHAPLLPETHHMLGQHNLHLLKDGAIIINTARGALIDEEALYDELKTGRILACLDVTDPEPPSPDHPLRSLPNVILTPHIAGVVNNGLYRLGGYVLAEAQQFINKQEPLNPVRREQLQYLA